jgi:tellurite methyltransferase
MIADVVLCNSVLHFSRDEDHFRAQLAELMARFAPRWHVFCRLGSRIGMDFEPVRANIFRVGDGSEWFLVDEDMLLDLPKN